jgi:signal transduction histidine kinase
LHTAVTATSSAGPQAEAAATAFLEGGGEVGARLRSLDFQHSPLGHPASWPQSLKTVVRIMLDSRYAMWMLWGRELTFFCNDAYLPTVGLKRDWVLGTRADKVWEEIWPEIGPRIDHVLQTGRATWDEGLLLFLERSGYTEETYHTFSYSPLYDDTGSVRGMLCVVTEVTERVISERRLAFLGRLGSAIAGAATEAEVGAALCDNVESCAADLPFAALYLFDENAGGAARRVALCGFADGTCAMLPDSLPLEDGWWPVQTLAGRSMGLTVPLSKLPLDCVPTAPWTIPAREVRLVPLARQGQHGAAGFLIVGLNPFRPFDEPYQHFLDLTAAQLAGGFAAVHAREEERRRAEALAELDRAKTDFFANVSHEFRTPLTLMIGPLEDALASERVRGDQELLEPLELAHGNTLRLLKLVNTLLDFSRLEAKRAAPQFEALDLPTLTADIASVFRAAIERSGLRFRVDCPVADHAVCVDHDMWEKIVLNLLSNAFKYTLHGEIRLSLRVADEEAQLTVSDTGAGIATSALPHLFERFYRITDTQARTHEGTGIGLALVHELVKLHGGRIEVQSRLGEGSVFRVVIPVRHAAREAAPLPVAKQRHGAAEVYVEEARRWLPRAANGDAASLPTAALPGEAVILLADDNADMRNYLARLLGQRFTVIGVGDGEEALAEMRRRRPDLLLSDVMMPRMDGLALLRAVRADPLLRELPVILLSARAGEEASVEGLNVGADDYLIKPFAARELLARVNTHLAMARVREESSRRKDEFLATLAHELRNPLAPIRHALAVAGSALAAPDQIRRSHAIIERQVRHMTVLLDDLLDVARITGGKLSLRQRREDVRGIIEAAVEASLPAITARGHELTVDIEPVPLPLHADAVRLAQVVSNLLNNAAKYTPAGGHVWVRAQRELQEVVIRVIDDGAGIAPESIPGLFRMFSQGTSVLERVEGGLGIGLALVKGVVELHGGTVVVKSKGLGHGSEFIVRLPVDTTQQPERRASVPAPVAGAAAAARKILVADDNRDAVETLQMLLQLDGHDVRVAYDGEQAVALAAQFAPELALLDIGMPKRNGYDAARALRERFPSSRMTLVAVTGWGQNSDRARALAAGFDHHLTKPVDPQVLQQLLQNLQTGAGTGAPL